MLQFSVVSIQAIELDKSRFDQLLVVFARHALHTESVDRMSGRSGGIRKLNRKLSSARQQTKLEEAVKRLNEQRQQIHDAQIPLSKTLSNLRLEAKDLNSQLAEQRRVRDNASLSLEQLQTRVTESRREYEYITGALFGEFTAAFKSALSPAEMETYGETLREHDLLLDSARAPAVLASRPDPDAPAPADRR